MPTPERSARTAPTSTTRHQVKSFPALLLLAGLIVFTIIAIDLDHGQVGVVHDDGIYLVSAQSLSAGHGYRLPSRPGSPPPKYPIGLPGVLAAALRIAPGTHSLPRDSVVSRAVVIVFSLIFFVAAYRWLCRVLPSRTAAALIVLCTAFHHVCLIGCATVIFSDLPFCALVYVLMERWSARAARGAATTRAQSLIEGVLGGAGLLLRGNGVSLVVASLVGAKQSQRKLTALVACVLGMAVVAVPISHLAARAKKTVPSGDYVLEMRAGWSSAAAGLGIIGRNAKSTLLEFPTHVVFPNASYTRPILRMMETYPAAARTLNVVVSLIVLFGLIRLARSVRPMDMPTWSHVIVTIAFFLVWPWNSIMDRFYLSLVPLVLLAFFAGCRDLARRAGVSRTSCRRIGTLTLTLVLAGNLSVIARSVMVFHLNGRQWPGASDRRSLDLALARISQLEPNAVIAAMWPETVYLYTGRQAVPLVEDDDRAIGHISAPARLKLWMDQAPGRPWYALVRNPIEDPTLADVGQLATLSDDPELSVHEVDLSAGERYRLFVIERRQILFTNH